MADETVITAAPPESAVPSTPAPVETAAPSTPAAPAEVQAEQPSFTNAQDRSEYLRETLAKAAEKPADKPAEAVAEVKPPEAEVKPAEIVEEKKPEEKPAEVKTEEVAADPLDKLGPLPAEKIAAALTADPDLEAKLAAAGLSKDALVSAAREAAVAGQFKELFPTLEIAQVAKQGSENFAILDTQFPAIKDEQTYNDFMMNTLVPMSYLLDADNNPIPDPNVPGTFKTDGSVARFISMTTGVEFNQIGKMADDMAARASSDEQKEFAQNLKAAVDYVQDFRNNGYRIPGTASAEKPAALPPDVQARLDRADQILREKTEGETKAQQEKFDTFESKVSDGTVAQMSPLIKDLLDQATALTDFEKETIAERVWKDLSDTLAANGDFKRYMNQMMSRKEFSDAVRDRRVAHNVTSMKAIYTGIVDKYLSKIGAARVSKNQALHAKIDTQKQAARMEPKTGAVAAAATATTLTDDQRFEKAKDLARAENNGEEPNNSQVIKALLKMPQSA